jgi:hypothetical protein
MVMIANARRPGTQSKGALSQPRRHPDAPDGSVPRPPGPALPEMTPTASRIPPVAEQMRPAPQARGPAPWDLAQRTDRERAKLRDARLARFMKINPIQDSRWR